VVAEGVETRAQQYFLVNVHHCDFMQGYLFGKPVPLDEFERRVLQAAQSPGDPLVKPMPAQD